MTVSPGAADPSGGEYRVSRRRIWAALATLADLTTEDHPELTGRVRDEIAHVRHVLHDLAEARRA